MRISVWPCLLALALLVAACGASPPVVGVYEAASGPGGPDRVVTLELREGGQGAWSADGESIAFKWDVRGDEVLLHTRAGGVIRVALGGGDLVAELPGAGRLVFRRREK